MSAAAKSQWPEGAEYAYEATGVAKHVASDEQSPALTVLTDAQPKAETHTSSARVAVEALVATNSKPAIGTLIASLAATEPTIRDEVVAGLKTATKQSLASKEEWENWWRNNKN